MAITGIVKEIIITEPHTVDSSLLASTGATELKICSCTNKDKNCLNKQILKKKKIHSAHQYLNRLIKYLNSMMVVRYCKIILQSLYLCTKMFV
jgi:hypothetical protein